MTNSKKIKNYILIMALVIYIIIYRLFIVENFLKYIEFINAAVLMIFVFIGIHLLGFQKDKITPTKKKVNIITLTQILLFFSVSYGIGLIVGYLKNSYSLTLYSIINNIFAPIIIIIATELFRYITIKSNKNSKKIIILITIAIILLELSTSIKTINFNDLAEVFKISASIVLPIIVKNCVLSYLTLHTGYKPALIYRLVMDLYVFVMPIVPNLGEYLNSMIGICLPFIIYIYASRIINEHNNGVEYEFQKNIFKVTDIPVIAFILLLVCLVSGYFPHYIIGIGSESMTPKINKGDAVIVEKIKSKKDLKEGIVIVYNNNGKNIVHRLVEIEKKGSNVYYRTKGDANNTRDNVDIKLEDIKGIVKFKIPYIAYPSIYFSEKIK